MKNKISICICCLLFSILSVPVKGQVSRAGLVAEYHMSANALDSSGQNNTGAMYNLSLSTNQSGVYGKALYFNGSTSYISIPHSNSLNFTTDLTVYALVMPTAYTTNSCQSNVMVSKWTNSNQSGFAIQFSDAWYDNDCNALNPNFECFYGATANNQYNGNANATRIQLNQWYCFAYVQSGYTQKQFVNGQLDYIGIGINNLIGSTTAPLRIGMNNNGLSSFCGVIDEVKVYNRALADSEIAMLCAQQVTAIADLENNEPEPVNIWSSSSDHAFYLQSNNLAQYNYEVYDLLGQRICTGRVGGPESSHTQVNLTQAGVYLVSFYSGGFSGVRKVVVP